MTTNRDGVPAGTALTPEDASLRRLCAEVEQVVSSELFEKSTVMAKLLSYLAQETVAGRDGALKSYTVAVEGLGRPSDFDARSDSYPRVQVARLRKLLEAFYAGPGAARDPCLHIPTGSYSVRLSPRGAVYPNVASAFVQSAPSRAESVSDPSMVERSARFAIDRLRSSRLTVVIVLVLSLLVLAVIASSILRPLLSSSAASPVSAIVVISPMSHDGTFASKQVAKDATAMLLNGLSRSWVLRVHTGLDKVPPDDAGHIYRLETQLGSASPGGRTIYVRLLDQPSTALIWTQEFHVPQGAHALENVLDSLVARVAGTFGLVATSEIRRLSGVYAPGYACALHYFRYTTWHNSALASKVEECLQKPNMEPRLEGTMGGIRAMSSLDLPATPERRRALILAGRNLADQAVADFPDDAIANFAVARLAFARQDCETGVRHSKLMLAQNDNDPVFLGVVSTLMSFCNAQGAAALVDRAFRFQVAGDASARLTTIFMAVVSNRRDRLEMLSSLPVQEDAENEAYNHFCNTMLYAALDRREEARSSWASYNTKAR